MRGGGHSSGDQNLGTDKYFIETFHGVLVPEALLSRPYHHLTGIFKALTCAAKGATMVFLHTRTLAAVYLLIWQGISQQVGRTPEVHPRLTTYKCTKSGGCVARNTSIVLDAELRKAETVNGTGVCKEWGIGPLNKTLCPDSVTCNRDCALEGANYTQWGVHTSGDELILKMYGDGAESPRVYLLDETGKEYEDFRVMNGEFTFDTDASHLPCGMCGALYFSEMEMSGGRSDLNPAGASLGTGYCDAQCYTDFTWVNGVVSLYHSSPWSFALNLQRETHLMPPRDTGKSQPDRLLLRRDGLLGVQQRRDQDLAAHVQPAGPVPVPRRRVRARPARRVRAHGLRLQPLQPGRRELLRALGEHDHRHAPTVYGGHAVLHLGQHVGRPARRDPPAVGAGR